MAAKQSRSFADQVSNAEVMLNGLRNNIETLSKRGINQEFIDQMTQLHQSVITTNNEQENLKATLKVKTDELNRSMTELLRLYAESRKLVKMELPQVQWVEFGISDKR